MDEVAVAVLLAAAAAAAAAAVRFDSKLRSVWLILANCARTSLMEKPAAGGVERGPAMGSWLLELLWDESLLEGREF